ncbi:hypothetical protein NQ317_009623 [Molorchus minor]|uniref:Bromo domain-containing protein n=1 Tax=Molorchus minor TaxID=1323400 RepID=A0ABQ9JJZ1_9CUCU|nr:hypothetical protein NQ317_009623 [Molorchus minor]
MIPRWIANNLAVSQCSPNMYCLTVETAIYILDCFILLFTPFACGFRQTEEDLQTGMHKILDYVKNHEDAWPFTDPVEEEYAPNYYSIIRKPMDLQKMEERLEAGYYKTYSKFRSDFQLIIDNCRLYNGAENAQTQTQLNKTTVKLEKNYYEYGLVHLRQGTLERNLVYIQKDSAGFPWILLNFIHGNLEVI